ncbi:hypothetical protein [Botrimarina hoheduenensis]|uniref:Uncharacterized protein n=1 Tax=Botrimarina hoheduenensis TaxID=2528000 RepID=A0A5C5WFF6_9BACT|nr:hypothetical protein [Botrimarina hoheduenensis]TWT48813.1 hypothetical protein Pla111_05880 [Botrimarina hoheduenensis]
MSPPSLSALADDLLLLAQRANWSRLGDQFSGPNLRFQFTDLVGLLALLLGFVGLVVGLHFALQAAKRNESRQSHTGLLQKLAATHRLTRSEQRLLRKIASQAALASPAEVFVRPELFTAGSSALGDQEAEARRLAKRLFSKG